MGVNSSGVAVAVDGGGSKTDVAVVALDTGQVIGRSRGPGCSHHHLGVPAAVAVIDDAVRRALGDADAVARDVRHAGCYLTAVDSEHDEAVLVPRLAAMDWAARSLVVANDLFALLRAGTDESSAAVVVCGTGINGLAVRSDGQVARIPALGRISGDWGGGLDLVDEVLWHAARAEDGRGEPTVLRDLVLGWSGAPSVAELAGWVHRGERDPAVWCDRMPDVVAAAASGDEVARLLIARQGEEIGVLAGALLARLGLADGPVPVVVGGGIGACGDPWLESWILAALGERAPAALLTVTRTPPIEGAVALALDHVAASG